MIYKMIEVSQITEIEKFLWRRRNINFRLKQIVKEVIICTL